MDLKDYVSETIYQIAKGVADAAERCKDIEAEVNPAVICGEGDNMYIIDHGNVNMKKRVQNIKMEISVMVSETSEVDGQVKAGISVVGTKVNGKSGEETQNFNKVSFQIPVCLPNPKH